MAKLEVRLQAPEETELYGVWGAANDKTLAKDIPALSAAFHKITGTRDGEVLPFVVLSRNYDEREGSSELFVGSKTVNDELSRLVLPAGEYAVITVKPKLGRFWGLAVGEAKRFFYTKWLPQSGFTANNLEYEYHTEKALGRDPSIDIIFSISKK